MGLYEDNSRSREYSVTEYKGLVHHFHGLAPHKVRSTINRNEARMTILRLTEPMTLITQKVQSSIEINKDYIDLLRKYRLTRSELEK
jgi:hypothetical protein